MKNLVIKNNYFAKVEYEKFNNEQKTRALLILILIIIERNRLIKSRGIANRKVQKIHNNRDEFSFPTPDFYAVKYVYAIATKKKHNIVTIDLLDFFLQTKAKSNEEEILAKFT